MRISVAITNYNFGPYVAAAIESVLSQTRPADQIVLLDDGSTDSSRSVLEPYRDAVEMYFSPNRGVVAATNAVLGYCTGDVVALLDADDIMTDERLERIGEVYEREPDVQWVFNALRHVDRATLSPLSSTPPLKNFVAGKRDLRAATARGRLPMSVPATSALSWRLPFLRLLLPIPAGTGNQDTYLAFPTLARGVGYVLEDPLTLQGIHRVNRFTGLSGQARDSFRAEHTVSLVVSYEELGQDLHALGDRLSGAALWLSRFGIRMPPRRRRELLEHVRRLSLARRGRVAFFLVYASAAALRQEIRRLIAARATS